jgi:hypothetical protein
MLSMQSSIVSQGQSRRPGERDGDLAIDCLVPPEAPRDVLPEHPHLAKEHARQSVWCPGAIGLVVLRRRIVPFAPPTRWFGHHYDDQGRLPEHTPVRLSRRDPRSSTASRLAPHLGGRSALPQSTTRRRWHRPVQFHWIVARGLRLWQAFQDGGPRHSFKRPRLWDRLRAGGSARLSSGTTRDRSEAANGPRSRNRVRRAGTPQRHPG